MRQYKISSYDFRIDAVEVTRESESSVWIMHNGKERRESNMYYYKSPQEAKEAIVLREQTDLKYAIDAMHRAERDLQKAMDIDLTELLKETAQTGQA